MTLKEWVRDHKAYLVPAKMANGNYMHILEGPQCSMLIGASRKLTITELLAGLRGTMILNDAARQELVAAFGELAVLELAATCEDYDIGDTEPEMPADPGIKLGGE